MVRTREVPPRLGPQVPVGRPPERAPYVPDRDLTYFRDGARWTFAGGKIAVQGHDLNRVISDGAADIGMMLGIAEGLNDYRKRVTSATRDVDQFARFEAVIEALLGKILGKLKRVYDQKMSGLSWRLEHGQLILNGINVRSFLALYRIRKTDKARRFLKGLKGKLAVLLENRSQSPDYERIREAVDELYREIDEELAADDAESAARASRRLLSGRSHPS